MVERFEDFFDPEEGMKIKGAKQIFIDALNEYIGKYEKWLQGSIGYKISYWETAPGKEGVRRANIFLNAFENITKEPLSEKEKIKKLFELTNQPQFKIGNKLPILLKQCVLKIAGFEQTHINIVAEQIADSVNNSSNELLTLYSYYDEICQKNAINSIYDHVIQSANFGHHYLKYLQKINLSSAFHAMDNDNNAIELEELIFHSKLRKG